MYLKFRRIGIKIFKKQMTEFVLELNKIVTLHVEQDK